MEASEAMYMNESVQLSETNQGPTQQRRKLLRRFYEPLLLLEALRKAPETSPGFVNNDQPLSSSVAGFRRSFVDGIAYLCASERFADCVTASALEKTPQGIVLWLATNNGVNKATVSFVEDYLGSLQQIASHEAPLDRQRLAEEISPILLRKGVTFGKPRLQKYLNNILNTELDQCIHSMRQANDEGTKGAEQLRSLCNWLEATFHSEGDLPNQPQSLLHLVLTCYTKRKDNLLQPLQLFACQGGKLASTFGRLLLLLCKLGKHVTITRQVVEATVFLYQDLRDPIVVRTVTSLPERAFPLTSKEGTVESILGRAFSNDVERDQFKTRLRSLWNRDEIDSVLSKMRPSKTKVHAELLLADHFHRKNLQFLDGHDKYVGCSKHTCYLCDAYLKCHPAGFAVRQSHRKIYAAWRCPDIPGGEVNTHRWHQEQEKILFELVDWVRKDLRREVESRTPRTAIPPDSTAGITSEGHIESVPFNPLRMLATLEEERQSSGEVRSLRNDTELQEENHQTLSGSEDEDGGVFLT